MDQDRQHTEQFTDEEVALRRHARFGQLPARVVPDDLAYLTRCAGDLIETKQTDPPHEEPQEPQEPQEPSSDDPPTGPSSAGDGIPK
jgi:hypothetical protein